MIYILPPIHGISNEVLQLKDELSATILHLKGGGILEEAASLSTQIMGKGNILIGFSIGGLIALEIAHLIPTTISKVIAIDTLAHPMYIPKIIRAYRYTLIFIPDKLFRNLYKRRHKSSQNLPTKEVFQRRLQSVFDYQIKPFMHTFWLRPVGDVRFGTILLHKREIYDLCKIQSIKST
jgi:pimeloyl-ACP methyl ester carboxylesterase